MTGKKLKRFDQFVNEDFPGKELIKKSIGSLKNWVSSLISKIKDGEIKEIPSGVKKGHPVVKYFAAGESKSIEDQLLDSYGDKAVKEEKIEEAKKAENSFLEFDGEDARNIDAEALKKELIDTFKDFISGEFDKPIFIFGAPGIGKTQIVAQAADALGVDLMDVDLQFMEPSDFLGVPKVIDTEKGSDSKPEGAGVTRPNPPSWLPQSNDGKNYKDKGGIIFFDELNRSAEPILNGMMILAQQRRVNTYKIPSKWFIVAAGNRVQDDEPERIKDLGPALWDRFTVVNYVPTVEGFTKHVLKYDKPVTGDKKLRDIVLPELLTFLEFAPEYFHNMQPGSPLRNFASPRGWINASRALYSKVKRMKEEGTTKLTDQNLIDIFRDQVGLPAAQAFAKFYKMVQNIKIEDIYKVFDDPSKAPLPSKSGSNYKPDDAFAFISAIVSKSKDMKLTPEQFSNAIKYSIRLNEAGYAQTLIMLLIAKHPYIKSGETQEEYITKLAEFSEFYHIPLEMEGEED